MASYSDSDAATTSSLLSPPSKIVTSHHAPALRNLDAIRGYKNRPATTPPCSVPLPRAFACILLSRTPAAMALSALPTSALSSLEAMLHSLMRGSGSRGGGAGADDDDDTPVHDDTLSSSPPPPPLPSRPTPRGRRPSRSRRRVRVQDTWPARAPPPPLSPVEVPSYDSLLRFPYRIKHC
jgi:hypothetical protein